MLSLRLTNRQIELAAWALEDYIDDWECDEPNHPEEEGPDFVTELYEILEKLGYY